jgi:hypothetical protein
MRHYTEDDLVLHHYGESRRRDRLDRHLETCPACAAMFREIACTLASVGDAGVPERDDRYGLEVWQRIRHDLPPQEAPWWRQPGLAGVVVLVIVAAFMAGRFCTRSTAAPSGTVRSGDAGADAGERVRLAAISDHLEQSERVLLDIINANGQSVDVSEQQAWAADLIDSGRLYRHAAERAGDGTAAGLLDESTKFILRVLPSSETVRRILPTGLPAFFNVNSTVLVSICIPERLSKSELPIDG